MLKLNLLLNFGIKKYLNIIKHRKSYYLIIKLIFKKQYLNIILEFLLLNIKIRFHII